jgi:MSHA biogenesis protein MshL
VKTWTKKYLALLAAGFLILVSSACTLVEPKSYNDGSAIDEALSGGIKANSSLKSSRKKVPMLPLALQKTLMPDVTLPAMPPSDVANEKQEQRFDIAVSNVPAKDFFMGLIKDTKYNITVNEQVIGNVSLELKSVTVPQVMDAVRDNYGFEYEKTSYGYKVFPRRLETRVFNVNYIDVDRTGQSQVTIGSGQITSNILAQNSGGAATTTTSQSSSTPSGMVSTSSSSKFWELLKQNLETIIGTQDGRSVVVNPRSGSVIVRAYSNELRYISQYLDNIQSVIHRQVIIEAKVLEVELTAGFKNGINWKALGLYQGSIIPTLGTNDTHGLSSEDYSKAIFPGNVLGVVGMNAHSGSGFSSVIQLLNSQGKVNVLSSPRIATINNQKAVIKVGDDHFFVTNVSSNTSSNSGSSTETANITLTPFFSGISLDVTPQVDENDNVTIHIHPIVSKVTQETKKFTVNQKEQELPLAASTVRESDSIVRAKNGQVIVIGGLMASEGQSYQASTPGADRLPGIGGLFKNNAKAARKFELVILLRPIIAEDTSTWQQQLREAAVNIKRMKDDFGYNIVPTKRKNSSTK